MGSSIWAIVLLFALLASDFRNLLFFWLQGQEVTTLLVLFILVWNWYYRW